MKIIIITLISSMFLLNLAYTHDRINNNEEKQYHHEHKKNKSL